MCTCCAQLRITGAEGILRGPYPERVEVGVERPVDVHPVVQHEAVFPLVEIQHHRGGREQIEVVLAHVLSGRLLSAGNAGVFSAQAGRAPQDFVPLAVAGDVFTGKMLTVKEAVVSNRAVDSEKIVGQ